MNIFITRDGYMRTDLNVLGDQTVVIIPEYMADCHPWQAPYAPIDPLANGTVRERRFVLTYITRGEHRIYEEQR